jgi:predicted MPP superfamily phosphohydrolase
VARKIRIAAAGDIHAGTADADRVKAAFAQAALDADLILLAGDLTQHGQVDEVCVVADACRDLEIPVVAVLGNHDWHNDGPGMRGALRAAGIPVLENDAHDAGGVWLAGLEDTRYRSPDVARALRDVPDDAPVIVLSHDPDQFPTVPGRVALTVSGHLHGGQVGVPVVRRPFIPSRFGERYAAGHVVEGGRHLYVTTGIGTTGWPIRLFTPPEAIVLRLMPASGRPRGRGARPRRGRAPSRAANRRPSRAPARRSR